MSNKFLYSLWGVLFIICAGLGFIPEPAPGIQAVFTSLAVLFFLPPALLLWNAAKRQDRYTRMLVRNLSFASLVLTLVLLVGNLLSAMQSEFLGNVLHGMLVIVSAPMMCSGYWVLSLFLWACLLMASIHALKKK